MGTSDYHTFLLLLLCLFLLMLIVLIPRIINFYVAKYRRGTRLATSHLAASPATKYTRRHYFIPLTISIVIYAIVYQVGLTLWRSQPTQSEQISAKPTEISVSISKNSSNIELIIVDNKLLSAHLSHFPAQHETDWPNRAACRHTIRIANIGITKESITSYSTVIEFEDQRLTMKGENDSISITREKLTDSIREFYTMFPIDALASTEADFSISPYTKAAADFPISIDSLSIVTITTELGFKVTEGVYDFESPVLIDTSDSSLGSESELYKPLMVNYIFITATGRQIVSAPNICWLLKKKIPANDK